MNRYTFLFSDITKGRLLAYLNRLRGSKNPGSHLAKAMQGIDVQAIEFNEFFRLLISTKKPKIFAESAVFGDGTDWNLEELALLGDVSVAVPVVVYDNGLHRHPVVHAQPFSATLLFTPGALLEQGHGGRPADWDEVVRNGRFDDAGYFALYERRLLPVLIHAHEVAQARGRKAIITVPGLGCGMFAGPYHGKMGPKLLSALQGILLKHASRLSSVKLVHFDPYAECDNLQVQYEQTTFRVRPLSRGNEETPQLCRPQAYAESGDDFSDCDLFTVVAWDHVSWPGNDFYGGVRATDDGVKAAATDSMLAMTGVEGRYDPRSYQYCPPAPFRTWEALVLKQGLKMRVDDSNLCCVPVLA